MEPISYFTTPELERLEVIDDIQDEIKKIRNRCEAYLTEEQYAEIEEHLVKASCHIKTIEDEARDIIEHKSEWKQYKEFIEDTRHRDTTKPVWSGYGCDAYVRLIHPYDRYEVIVEGHGTSTRIEVNGRIRSRDKEFFESIYENEAKWLYEKREE